MPDDREGWLVIGGFAAGLFGLAAGAALAGAKRSHPIRATQSILHAGGLVQQVWDRVPAPRYVYGGQSVYESVDRVPVGDLLPLTGAIFLRVQLVGFTGTGVAPNFNFTTFSEGAVKQGNGQRFIDFTVDPVEVPVAPGTLTQFTLEYQAPADMTRAPIGAILDVD